MRKLKCLKRNKKGFSLIEVMLAVAILLFASTMIMNGFMSTMKYSYSTSVYAKSAADNYKDSTEKLNTLMGKNFSAYGILANDADANDSAITISGTAGGKSVSEVVNLKEFKYDSGADVTLTGEYAEDYGDNDDTYANNRTTFYYYPSYNGSGESLGKVRIYYDTVNKKYVWVNQDTMTVEKDVT